MTLIKSVRLRVLLVCFVSAGALFWNTKLSKRRAYLLGTFIRVEKKDVELKVNCPGKIEPRVQETLKALFEGMPKQIYVKEGDLVKEGQLLMEISDELIKADLRAKQVTLKNAQTEASKAKRDLALEQKLFAKGAIPRRQVEGTAQAYEKAMQSLTSASEDLAKVEKKMLGIRVISPINGVVIKLFADTENPVSPHKELIKVAQLDSFLLKAKVDELDISHVNEGQKAKIVCDAFANQELEGTVSQVGVSAQDGEVDVKINIDNAFNLSLKPNMLCDGLIISERVPNALVLPANAVRQGPSGPYVLLTETGGWIKEVKVELDQNKVRSGLAIITSGVRAGDKVLVPKDNEPE